MKRDMIQHVVRKSLPELMIGVAACGAALMLLVDPLQRRLTEAQNQVGSLQQAVASLKSSPGALIDAQGRTQEAQRALDGMRDRGVIVADRTEMFRSLMNLAEQSGVRVNQFQPSTPRVPRPKAAPVAEATPPPMNGPQKPMPGSPQMPVPSAAAAKPKFETRVAYVLNVQGDYGAIARFVNALQQDVGFSVVRAVRLAPGAEGDLLAVQIETEHVAIDTKAFVNAQSAASGAGGRP